jgi:hypothetical protein
MSRGHTTCKGLTAVRRSRFGHPKEFFFWLGNISTECKSCDTSQTARKGRQLGGEEKVKVTGKAKVKDTGKAKVKDTGKAKVKVKVQAKVAWKCIPPLHLSSLPMRGFRGMRGKMLRRAEQSKKLLSF